MLNLSSGRMVPCPMLRQPKGSAAGCDEEALRVMRSVLPFKSAAHNGKPVRARLVVPVVFQLNAGETNPDNNTQGMVIIEEC